MQTNQPTSTANDLSPEYYVWCDGSCDNKTNSLLEAMNWRDQFVVGGRMSYIVDSDSVEPTDHPDYRPTSPEALIQGMFAGRNRGAFGLGASPLTALLLALRQIAIPEPVIAACFADAFCAVSNDESEVAPLELELNAFNHAGEVRHSVTAQMTVAQIEDIVCHAAQAIVVRNANEAVDSILDELEEALESAQAIFRCD